MKPNYNETRMARRMLRRRLPMHVIVRVFDNKYQPWEITDAVIAQRLKERDSARELREKTPILPASKIEARSNIDVPAFVIADRERRIGLVPRDTTAAFCGDPLPGYSMAEKAPGIAPSIHRDPLDGLMFKRRKVGVRFG